MQATPHCTKRVSPVSSKFPVAPESVPVTPVLSFPQMSRAEFLDLEREAGHPFLSDEQAHLYRLAKIFRLSVENLLAERTAERSAEPEAA